MREAWAKSNQIIGERSPGHCLRSSGSDKGPGGKKAQSYTLGKDLRNHGESPHDCEHSYAAMASDIEEFLQTHKLERVALIGHSMSEAAQTITILWSDHGEL